MMMGGSICIMDGHYLRPTKNRVIQKIYRKVMRRMFPKKTEEEIYSTNPGIMGGNVVELEQDMLTVKSFQSE